MSKINQNANAPMNTLKPQPGQYDSYHPKFHPLPGQWAKEQLSQSAKSPYATQSGNQQTLDQHNTQNHGSQTTHGPRTSHSQTEIGRALAAERSQHEYWEEWQGVTPGKPVYEDPRAFQNTLLPTARYGTDGR